MNTVDRDHSDEVVDKHEPCDKKQKSKCVKVRPQTLYHSFDISSKKPTRNIRVTSDDTIEKYEGNSKEKFA